MNRLWVRLSLMIAGVLFLVFFLQFLSIMTVVRSRSAVGNHRATQEPAGRSMMGDRWRPAAQKSRGVWSTS